MNQPPHILTRIFSLFFSGVMLIYAWSVNATSLAADYRQAVTGSRLSTLPFIVESMENENRLSVKIYSELEQPYKDIVRIFTTLSNWCEFTPLHLNVKACTYQQSGKDHQLTLYLGRKFYQPPEDTHQITYRFHLEQQDDTTMKVSMTAQEGPLGTEAYQLGIEAAEFNNKTLVRVSMAYTPSILSRLATSTYLATLGRNKVGFSVTGVDSLNQPIFISGVKAVIERNAMRYYLAMKAYIETQPLPASERFEARIRRWFELTELYQRQLQELDENEYLAAKRRERQNQVQLQRKLANKAENQSRSVR